MRTRVDVFGCLVVPLAAACHHEAPVDRSARSHVNAESAPIVEQAMPRIVPLTGTLEADVRTELTANATGRVTKTFVERGQKVRRGTVLAQLDIRSASLASAEARASVASAKTQLESAKAECDRYEALLSRGAVTRQEYDKQTAQCRQQQASLTVSQVRAAEAALSVGDGTIRAPFSGIVTNRAVSVGDYVQPPSKVVALVVTDPLRLHLTVPERRISDVKEGAIATFFAPAFPGKEFEATVKYIGGEVRAATRDLVVEAMVPNPEGELLPGMFVSVSLRAGDHPMPVVPKGALFETGTERSLYIVDNGHLSLRIVKTGGEQGGVVAIEEGAQKGELVVLHPTLQMSNGAIVDRD